MQRLFDRVQRTGSSFAAGRWRLALLLFSLPIILRLSIIGSYPKREPLIHDEFGHLLLADTLRYGRFANPPHALSEFFDAIYIAQHPTYSATYPPGQAFMLFTGKLLFGDPWAGVLLATAFLGVMVWWALRAWVSPGWALFGAMLVLARIGLFGDWMNSYWGGSLAGVMGSLVIGLIPRLERVLQLDTSKARRATLIYSVFWGIGLGFHFLIRPFETLSLGIVALAYLNFRGLRNSGRRFFKLALWKRVVPVASIPVFCALGISIVQNYQVTGDWRKLPYVLTREQYGVPQTFVFQKAAVPELPLRQEQMANYRVQLRRHDSTLWERIKERSYLLYFDAGIGLTACLFLSVLAFRDSRFWWALFLGGLPLLISLGYGYFYTHYVSGFIVVWILVPLLGLECLSRMAWWGRSAVFLVALVVLLHPARIYTAYLLREILPAKMQRGFIASMSDDLVSRRPWFLRPPVERALRSRGGSHLVFVTELPSTSDSTIEWVYNAADIDHAPLVWAHSLGLQKDEALKRYYGHTRSCWIVNRDIGLASLKPY